jgi:hypothetical protein
MIEIVDNKSCPSRLSLRVGDVLFVRAVGAHIRPGDTAVEMLGPFTSAVVGTEGSIIEPMGPPNTVLFRALSAGRARLEIVTSEPFSLPVTTVQLSLTVKS